ncbi:MAG: hypothetical protein ABIN89_18465 [Chitinophagaceae bacterium]
MPETAMDAPGQLFNLSNDPVETTNLYFTEADKRKELQLLLEKLKVSGRSAPLNRQPLGVDRVRELARQKAQNKQSALL